MRVLPWSNRLASHRARRYVACPACDTAGHPLLGCTMKLSSLLSPKQVILDLKGEVCADALANMVGHLISRGVLDAGLRAEVIELLEERERQVSTGIGSGVAIPHAFSDSIDRVVAALDENSSGSYHRPPERRQINPVQPSD